MYRGGGVKPIPMDFFVEIPPKVSHASNPCLGAESLSFSVLLISPLTWDICIIIISVHK